MTMHAIARKVLLSALALCCADVPYADESEAPLDASGRMILQGPVGSGIYSQVHIVSKSVGVFAVLPTTIVDSVIEAPVCVSTSGRNLTLRGNVLDCALCVEFTEGFVANNTIADNTCTGRGTNRPDVLGW
jgi:hypothetical protein